MRTYKTTEAQRRASATYYAKNPRVAASYLDSYKETYIG